MSTKTKTKKRRKMTRGQLIILALSALIAILFIYFCGRAAYIMFSLPDERVLSRQEIMTLVFDFDNFKLFPENNAQEIPQYSFSADDGSSDPSESESSLPQSFITDHQINILLLGLDEKKTNTDLMLVASIDLSDSEETRSIKLLQIPRDTYVGIGAAGKINGVYTVGNSELTPVNRVIEVIYEQFKLPIDHYITLDLEGFKNIVDAIGGIPMNVPQRIEYDAASIINEGYNLLNGTQAEWFVRYRKGYAEGDIGREKMQRLFMAAALQRAKDMGWTDLVSCLPELAQYVNSDMTVKEFEDIMYVGTNMEMDDISIYMLPGEATYQVSPIDGKNYSVWSVHKSSVVTLLNDNFRPYQEDVYSYDLGLIELANTSTYYENTDDSFQDLLNGETPGEKNEE